MSASPTDAEMYRLTAERLNTSVVGDTLDRHGYRHQFLPPRLRPLGDHGVVVGRAMPVLEADVFDYKEPFGKMFEALDDLKPGDVYLAAGGSTSYAFFGELMAIAATARGAHGAVLCGYHRDSVALLASGFPVFSYGGYGQDQGVRGRVLEYRVPIEVAGVRIEPGDLLVADVDGVVVVPQRVEALVIDEALEKVSTESRVREALKNGMLASEAFEKFGVM